MGVRILETADGHAVLYCSTTMWAFGPVISASEDDEQTAVEQAEKFIRWLPQDARLYKDPELERKYGEFLALPPQKFPLDNDLKE